MPDHMTTYARICEELGRQQAALWSTVYPRAYRDAGDHHSPKVPATMLGHAVQGARVAPWEALPPSTRQLYYAAAKCAEHAMPTYFVARTLLEAVARTSPPADLRWQDIPLPHEGMILMLPRGALRHEREGDIGAIVLARVRALERVSFPAPGCRESMLREDVLIACGCAHEWPTMPTYDLTLNAATAPTLAAIPDIITGTNAVPDGAHGLRHEPTSVEDARMAQTLMSLALRIALVMSARPELIEPGVQTGTQRKARTDTPIEYWTPTMVGRTYRVRIDTGAAALGAHAGPRLHWRRGHYAAQPHGPNFSLRKIIWREPTLVGETAAAS